MKNTITLSDEELVALAKNGDAECETELLYRHKKTVMGVSRDYYLISGENEDLVQEGMIALYKAIHTYNPEKNASFKTFVVTCVRRHIIDVVRRTSHDAPVPATPYKENMAETPEYDQLWVDVRKNLSDNDVKVLDDYLSGLSYLEIASKRGITTKKVDNDLQKIKKVIKKVAENYKI